MKGRGTCDILVLRPCAFPTFLSLKKVNSKFETVSVLPLRMPNIEKVIQCSTPFFNSLREMSILHKTKFSNKQN